jgi:hypothetical protein
MHFTPQTIATVIGDAHLVDVYTVCHQGRDGVVIETTIGTVTVYGREVFGFAMGHIGTITPATNPGLVRRYAVRILAAAKANRDRDAAIRAAEDAARPAFVLPEGMTFLDYLLTPVTNA